MVIAFKRVDADTTGQGWVDDGEGGVCSAWSALGTGGLFMLTMKLPPGVLPDQAKVTWTPFAPVAKPVRAVQAVKPARLVKPARIAATVIDLASWRIPRRPN